jgi:hypothetical protein
MSKELQVDIASVPEYMQAIRDEIDFFNIHPVTGDCVDASANAELGNGE